MLATSYYDMNVVDVIHEFVDHDMNAADAIHEFENARAQQDLDLHFVHDLQGGVPRYQVQLTALCW